MTQRFNPPPGWPVPSGWSPTAGWEPDLSWPAAPAGWQFWLEDVAEQSGGSWGETPYPTMMPTLETVSPGRPQKRLVILGTVGVVVLVALAGAVAMFLHSRDNGAASNISDGVRGQESDVWKTLPSAAPTVLPAGAVECGVSLGGVYRGAARGNDVTSCPFAVSVRDALNGAGGQVPTSVNAYSPVTKKRYVMSCTLEQVITCRGGNNAVVYVYE